ncbi:MAG: NrtA/SsuA/CpmA family ABC transporter substrate-binding protein [Burkholderiaceae bacterium]
MTLQSLLAAVGLAWLAAGAHAATPDAINISYVKAPFNLQSMVMREHQLLEKEFAADGIQIHWHSINSGAQQAQAMAAGALDIGGVMNTTSVLLANAGGNPVKIAAGVSRPAQTFAIVSRPGATFSIEQLRGKKIAGPRGTVLHQLLVAALASKGIKPGEVEFISMDIPKAQTALIAGHVDAALLAAGSLVKAVEQGGTVVTTAAGLVDPVLVVSVSQAFAQKHPALLARVLKVHRAAGAWVAAHRPEAIALGAKEQGIALADAKQLADWTPLMDTLSAADIRGVKADMQFLLDHDLMKAPVAVDALLLPSATGAAR